MSVPPGAKASRAPASHQGQALTLSPRRSTAWLTLPRAACLTVGLLAFLLPRR